ncbi:asparaginase [Pseudomonas sp. GD03860]|uniref:asparaginase n=1 Tax=Pseudomonas TaxID=286 RepID=UPI002364A320|nr:MULTISPECIES: asparaginase [Pseudomonas]MDD2057865.1 asparaginase [Pseudomonas putida]MDH0638415.1 asparaginase [Pseudomonas sp. GD03860]
MSATKCLPLLAIGSLGGTVCMQVESAGQGVTPSLSGEALVAGLPQLQGLARISAETLQLLPSASLTFIQLLDVLHWADAQVKQGAQGVVLTQGTDTLEEVAYFMDLLWPHEAPLVLTGAMRSANQAGADGPANLFASVQVALAAESQGRGALVVINDQIHAALNVRKADSLAMDAFTSSHVGPQGLLIEGRVCYLKPSRLRYALPAPQRLDHRVALLEASLSADTLLLEEVAGLGYEGLVIAGFGAGHVSQEWARCLGQISQRLSVVVATRTGAGTTASRTYGFKGGEIDLQRRGVRMAGFLCPRKCRVLLWVLIGCGMEAELEHHLQAQSPARSL